MALARSDDWTRSWALLIAPGWMAAEVMVLTRGADGLKLIRSARHIERPVRAGDLGGVSWTGRSV